MLGKLHLKLDWTVAIIILVNGIRGVFSALPVPLSWDEAVYSNLASDLVHFGFYCFQPFQVLLDYSRVPVLYFTIYLAYLVTTPNTIVAQMVSFMFSLGGIFAVYLLGKEMYGETVGRFSALALSCGLTFFIIVWGILSEVPFILFSSLFLLFIVRAQKNFKYYVPAGVCLTLSFLSRYPGVLILFVGLFYIALSRNIRKTLKSPWFYLGILLAFITAVPWLCYSKMNTGDYFGMLKLFFYSTQTWNRTLYTNPFISPSLLQFVLFYLESAAYAVIPIVTPAFLFPYFYYALKAEKGSVSGKTLMFWIFSSMLIYFILMTNSRLVDLFRYNQTSLPAFSILTGFGLAILLTEEFKDRKEVIRAVARSLYKNKKNIALLLLILNVSGGFIGVYMVRTNQEVYQPLPIYEYLKWTTAPWQIILTNVYPMATHYTNRFCMWIPDIPEMIDYYVESGCVRAVFVSLFNYVPIAALAHLVTSPLYEIELIGWYNGFPAMIVFRTKI
ncbi:MAG: glycosyltransferase family 39 protein [Candidatus Jordarchaeaceae archaeon]